MTSDQVSENLVRILVEVPLFFAFNVFKALHSIKQSSSIYPLVLLVIIFVVFSFMVHRYCCSHNVFDHPQRVRLKDITRIFRRTKMVWLYKFNNDFILRSLPNNNGTEAGYVIHIWPNFLSASNCNTEWDENRIHDMKVSDFLCQLQKITIYPLYISLYSYPENMYDFLYSITTLFTNKNLCKIFGVDVYNEFRAKTHKEMAE